MDIEKIPTLAVSNRLNNCNMKNIFLVLTAALIALNSCMSTKKVTTEKLYGTAWELEYLSEPNTGFAEIFPSKTPKIEFKKEGKRVEGNSGCNGYGAEFNLVGTNLTFGEPGPSTMMYCGEGEEYFRKAMAKVNSYEFGENDKLVLKLDDKVLMRFKKVEP